MNLSSSDPESEELDSSDSPLMQGIKILLVEDDPIANQLLHDLLTAYGGAEVTSVTSSRQALEVFQQLQPDVLISNIVLPDQDGFSLIKEIRKLESKQEKRIVGIAITASANAENQTRLVEASFQGYFFKPFEIEEIIELIHSLL